MGYHAVFNLDLLAVAYQKIFVHDELSAEAALSFTPCRYIFLRKYRGNVMDRYASLGFLASL